MNFIKKIIKKFVIFLIGYDFFEKKLILEGFKLSNQKSRKSKIINFKDVEFSVFSQWGDDGIIDWLTTNIPIKKKIFLEIGTEDYRESNTRFLLIKKNWSGHLIESEIEHTKNIKKQSIYWKYDLNVHNYQVNQKNINKIIKIINLRSIGLLSLDIDGIDYWIWKEINELKPIIFVCEFNSTFGTKSEITVPYKKNFNRTKFHYSNLAFGGSISAFINLSKKKGYEFVGTNSNGVNAYFIKKNYYKFIKKKIRYKTIFSSKTRESRDRNYQKTFLSNNLKTNKIKNVKVYDIKKKKIIKFKNVKL